MYSCTHAYMKYICIPDRIICFHLSFDRMFSLHIYPYIHKCYIYIYVLQIGSYVSICQCRPVLTTLWQPCGGCQSSEGSYVPKARGKKNGKKEEKEKSCVPKARWKKEKLRSKSPREKKPWGELCSKGPKKKKKVAFQKPEGKKKPWEELRPKSPLLDSIYTQHWNSADRKKYRKKYPSKMCQLYYVAWKILGSFPAVFF